MEDMVTKSTKAINYMDEFVNELDNVLFSNIEIIGPNDEILKLIDCYKEAYEECRNIVLDLSKTVDDHEHDIIKIKRELRENAQK